MRAKGMGARVVVTEVDPVRALEAVMDGFAVMPITDAAAIGDFFCTVTGNKHVIGDEAFACMKDGAVIANSGHFDIELDLHALEAVTVSRRPIRDSLEELELRSGRRLFLLAQGRLVNLSAAEGHPADVMDLSFANQALAAEHLRTPSATLQAAVHGMPVALDHEVARLKLHAMGVGIDSLSEEQRRYLASWRTGT